MHSLWLYGPCYAAKVLCSFAIVYWISYHIKSKACYYHFEAIKERIHMNVIFYFRNSITETFFLESTMSLWHVLSRLSQVCGVLHVLSLDSEAACDRGCLEDSLSYLGGRGRSITKCQSSRLSCQHSDHFMKWNGSLKVDWNPEVFLKGPWSQVFELEFYFCGLAFTFIAFEVLRTHQTEKSRNSCKMEIWFLKIY